VLKAVTFGIDGTLERAGCKTQGMTMTGDRERKAAESEFKKSERATKGAQAMSEYKADGDAERAKTARLKALREAKEAADKVAKQAKPTKKRWSTT
jgi:hypothetical protein